MRPEISLLTECIAADGLAEAFYCRKAIF